MISAAKKVGGDCSVRRSDETKKRMEKLLGQMKQKLEKGGGTSLTDNAQIGVIGQTSQ